jgi:TonB-dependent starch-binding outer membrane protein SusC
MKNLFMNGFLPKWRKCKKILLIMRLSLILTFATLLNATASVYSQSVKINLDLKDATLETVFKSIQDQTEFDFFYKNEHLPQNKVITKNYENTGVDRILDEVLEGTGLVYRVLNTAIVVTKGIERTSTPGGNDVVAQQQPKIVTGTVTGENGQPLPGVTVVVKGTTEGTVTDADGKFSLNVPEDVKILTFSFVGFKTQEVQLGDRTVINIQMEEDIIGIEEVVAIGYGTRKKEDLTGSIVSADMDAVIEQPNVSLMEVLQGAVPGLNVGQVDQAGENPVISIRGQVTLSGEQAPLIVLDGVIFRGELIDINPNDIKSVDVLKDASAAAIYGSQASNGVIILRTISGKGAGKPSIRYTGRYSFQQPHFELRAETDPGKFLEKTEHSDIEQSRTEESGYLERNPNWSESTNFKTSAEVNNYIAGRSFDWYDHVTTDHPYISSHNISISNETEKNNYFASIGYTEQDGHVLDEYYERINGRINFFTAVTNWLDVDVSSYLTTGKYGPETYDLNTRYFEPFAHPFEEDGSHALYVYTGTNPLIQADVDFLDERLTLGGNISGTVYLPIEGLKFQMRFGNNYLTTKNYGFGSYGASFQGAGYKTNMNEYNMSLDNILSYSRTFDKIHELDVTLLYGFEERENEFTTAEGSIFANHVLGYNRLQAADASQQKAISGGWKESSLYNMGRLSYKLMNRYLINATIRRDGFSGFSKKNKFGYFPSFALGWVISEESFLKSSTDWLNWLKLRISYGATGNRTLGRYTTLAKVSGNPGYVTADGSSIYTQWISSLESSELKWETTTGLNIGFDLRMLDSRLNASIDYYNNNTTDLLYNVDIPALSRYTVFPDNLGKIHNQGFEIQLTSINIREKDLTWTTDFTFSRNRDKIVTLLGFDLDGDGKEDDLISEGLFIGESLGAIYDYKIDGIWQLDDEIPPGYEFGSYKVIELNNDGNYDPEDKTILGNRRPSYRFAVNNVLNYKNWTLRLFVNSVQGGKDRYLGADNFHDFEILNSESHYNWTFPKGIDYWTPENPNAKYERPGIKVSQGLIGTRYTSRSFIRLRDLSLSYRVNSNNIDFIQNMKIILSGRNLLTLTKWPGWDPETGEGITRRGRPVMESYSLGIDVTF